MYMKQNRDKQKDIRVVSLEDLVPRDHLLRKIDRAINFDFIYEEVKDLYSATEWHIWRVLVSMALRFQ